MENLFFSSVNIIMKQDTEALIREFKEILEYDFGSKCASTKRTYNEILCDILILIHGQKILKIKSIEDRTGDLHCSSSSESFYGNWYCDNCSRRSRHSRCSSGSSGSSR